MYRANNGKRIFDPRKQIKDGTFTKNTSFNPLWAIRGDDGRPSWAMDWSIFDYELPRYNVTTIVFINKRSGEVYETTYETFAKFGKKFNVGHGLQIALPFQYWSVVQGEVKPKRLPKSKKAKIVKPAKSWLQRSFLR